MADRAGVQQIPGLGSDMNAKRPLMPAEGNNMNSYARSDRVPPNHSHDDYHTHGDPPHSDGQLHVICYLLCVTICKLTPLNIIIKHLSGKFTRVGII